MVYYAYYGDLYKIKVFRNKEMDIFLNLSI